MSRRLERLRELVRAARSSSLLGEHDVDLIIHQETIARVLEAHLPWEEVVADRFYVRITGVDVECEDGLALLRLYGSVSVDHAERAEPFAAVRLFGEVGVVAVDDATGTLRGQVSLLAFEARPIAGIEGYPMGRRLLDELGRLRIGAFAALARAFEIPVHLERAIDIPADDVKGPVGLRAGRIDVALTVTKVLAYEKRLWVAFRADGKRVDAETETLVNE